VVTGLRIRGGGRAVSIYAIDGMAEVGKTAFARHAAQIMNHCGHLDGLRRRGTVVLGSGGGLLIV
jgi:hypothetical protein